MKCYMMCHGNLLSIADDEESPFFQEIMLTRYSVLLLFNDPSAPQAIQNLWKKKPGGFAVFQDKNTREQPWLFDTPSPHAQAQWVKNVQSCLEYIRLGVHDVWIDNRVQQGLRRNVRAQRRLLKELREFANLLAQIVRVQVCITWSCEMLNEPTIK